MPYQSTLEFNTFGRGSRDITAAVADVVTRSAIRCGLAHVFVQHTSCSLLITENADPDVRHDLETILKRLAPDGDPAYCHTTEGPDDMSAHVRTMLTATSITVPVGDGRLLLGTWQGMYLWEHRVAEHRRNVVVTVMGDAT
ncbi:MAG: secondary thiamine-phosphate synthase enzyme YjbQ [Massilia sp.]